MSFSSMFPYMCTVFSENPKLLQTKEPTNNSFTVPFGFQEIGIIFSLKMVHMYWNMLVDLI
jgi:hypothetical protein